MLEAGVRIGKYEVVRELGHGGFGILYVARDVGLDREVALKVLRAEHLERQPIVDRFLQEARAAAKIDHPGIVTVFECGEATEVGSIYIAMELLRGENLAQRLVRGKIPLAMAVNVTRQAANALAAAHRAGIVHRDLKPDNLFLVPDSAVLGGERVKLLDFGIAKLSDPGWHPSMRTHSMTLLGTPLYMSPEQCKSSAKVDARSDVYALGCIVFEMACGKPPYEGDPGELIAQHQLAPVPSAKARAPELPDGLDKLLRSMLAKMPDDRPTGMEQVEAELAAIDDEPGDDTLSTTAPDVSRGRTRRRRTSGTRASEELTVPTDIVADPVIAPIAPTAPAAPVTRVPVRSVADKTMYVASRERSWVVKLERLATTHRRVVVGACIVAAGLLALGVVVHCGASNVPSASAKRSPAADAAPRPQQPMELALPDAQVVVVLMPIDAAAVPVDPPVDAAAVVVDAAIPPRPPVPHDPPRPPPHQPPPQQPLMCADLDSLRTRGQIAMEGNNFVAAESIYMDLVRCGDASANITAYLAACRGHHFDDARALFRRFPTAQQERFKQICEREGIDPSQP